MVPNPDQHSDEPPFGGRTMLLIGLSYVLAVVFLLFFLAEVIVIRGSFVLVFAILVPLIPFLIIMAYTGRLTRVSAGRSGFEFVFAQVASREIQPISLEDEIVEIPPSHREAPVTGYDVEDGEAAHRPVLWFRLGRWNDSGVVDEFVENMPRLSFVIFTDPLGQFKGLMSATDFRSIYLSNPEGFLDRIEHENISNIAGVVTGTISPDSTNAEALEKMANENVNKLGVVNDEGEFIGVITQDAISRGILSELFHKTEP
jgi:CBS domain-containing protein